jgi:uncharacterized protein YbcI
MRGKSRVRRITIGAMKPSISEHPAAHDGAVSDGITGSPLLHISNAMVRLYKDAFGRGPTKARAMFAGHDTLLVVLEDSMTPAERNLAGMGEHERLRTSRQFLQYALEDEFRKVVEHALGRRTLAFVSGFDTHRDVAVEVFTLQPRGMDGDGALPSPEQTLEVANG